MVNSLIMLAMVIVGTTMVSYIAFRGRLTSRAVLMLMPAVTLAIAGLVVLAETDDPLLPVMAVAVLIVALMLLLAGGGMLAMQFITMRSLRKDTGRADKAGGGVEA